MLSNLIQTLVTIIPIKLGNIIHGYATANAIIVNVNAVIPEYEELIYALTPTVAFTIPIKITMHIGRRHNTLILFNTTTFFITNSPLQFSIQTTRIASRDMFPQLYDTDHYTYIYISHVRQPLYTTNLLKQEFQATTPII